jgi:hypothetical protein
MRKLIALVSLLTSLTAAAEFVAYQQLNNVVLINDEGKTISTTDISNVRDFDLREDIAIVKSAFSTITIFNQNGEAIIKDVYAQDYKITKNFMVFLGGKVMKVFDRAGKLIEEQSWIKSIGASDNFYAYISDRVLSELVVKDITGKEIINMANMSEAMISNNFIFAKDQWGYLRLFNKEGEVLRYGNNYVKYDLSNNFVTLTDNFGFTELMNSEENVILSSFDLNILNLLNDKALVQFNGLTQVIDANAETLYWLQGPEQVATFQNNFLVTRMNSFNQFRINYFQNTTTQTTFAYGNIAIASKAIIAVNEGPGQYSLYTKNAVIREFNSNIQMLGLGENLYTVLNKTARLLEIKKIKNNQSTTISALINVLNVWNLNSNPRLNLQKF